MWRGGLSWRRLGVLVKHLPPESATKTALRNAAPDDRLTEAVIGDAPYGPWSQTDMLLADLIDVARWLQWAKSKDGEDNKNRPEPYPRPGVQRKGAVTAKVINLLDYIREHNGAAPDNYTAAPEGAQMT